MNLAICYACGAVVGFAACCDIYGCQEDYYGVFTKCPICGICLYKEKVSKVNVPFEEE